MTNFDRQYRFAAGQAGGKAFEIGECGGEIPMPLRVQFSFEKTDLESPNTGKSQFGIYLRRISPSLSGQIALHRSTQGTAPCVPSSLQA